MKMYQELLICAVEQDFIPKVRYSINFFFSQQEASYLKEIIILMADLIKILDDNVK